LESESTAEFYYFRVNYRSGNIQDRNRPAPSEARRSGAARIHVENAIDTFHRCDMRVTVYNDINASRSRINQQFL